MFFGKYLSWLLFSYLLLTHKYAYKVLSQLFKGCVAKQLRHLKAYGTV